MWIWQSSRCKKILQQLLVTLLRCFDHGVLPFWMRSCLFNAWLTKETKWMYMVVYICISIFNGGYVLHVLIRWGQLYGTRRLCMTKWRHFVIHQFCVQTVNIFWHTCCIFWHTCRISNLKNLKIGWFRKTK
jgi:hypothetical protein